jgi:long-chain acyl-CoA synthetase
MLAKEPSGRPWSSLRLAVSTAAALTPATAQAFDARYGVPLSQGLGIIEVGLPFLNTAAPRKHPVSIGAPTEDVAFELREPDTNAEVAPGETGELWIHTDGMLDAYLNPWRLQKEILADNRWFRTGDLARLAPDGHLYLQGRTRTVINVAGMKCFPEEIEAVLRNHPGVREARVRGQVHPYYGAVPVADIVPIEPRPEARDLRAYCGNYLANYKVPVEFVFARAIPKTPSGKIKRL